jgi:gamma-glutamyl-gamma-aminobutyrate hydrolase PuuD
VPEFYLARLTEAGAVPVILPVHTAFDERLLERLDGVVLTGGVDVDPARYGRTRDSIDYGVDEERDAFEIQLVRAAYRRQMPLFAICRGAQVMNVALGGTLIEDLGAQRDVEHWDLERWNDSAHHVRVTSGSRVASLIGTETLTNSMHHQAVDRVADTLDAVAWALDGTVEAIENPDMPYWIGVQWHPECLGPSSPSFEFFPGLVRAAEEVHG